MAAAAKGTVGVIIPAGGSGSRMGGKTEKQFLKIKGKTILDLTLSRFNRHPGIAEMVLVLPEARVRSMGTKLMTRYKKLKAVTAGGAFRTHSVINGFNAFLKDHKYVLIHDCVRPFVDAKTITQTIGALKKYPAVTVAVRAKDTMKAVRGTKILNTPDRSALWHTQTPQGFRANTLRESLDYALIHRAWDTDECQLAEKLGKNVHVVEGSYFNFKITTPEDMVFAKSVAGLKR